MTGWNAANHQQRPSHIVGGASDIAGLVSQAEAMGVRLEARLGGRLWADRPNLLPAALRDNLAAHRQAVVMLLAERPMQAAPSPAAVQDVPQSAPSLPGVPSEWRRGVALLANLPAPTSIPARRWAILAATSARLMRDHGAALHAAGWDALDLFGLDLTAPATNPPGWGLAWLLSEHGEVLDVTPHVVGIRRTPDGARLAYRKRSAAARAGAAVAWTLAASSRQVARPAACSMPSTDRAGTEPHRANATPPGKQPAEPNAPDPLNPNTGLRP